VKFFRREVQKSPGEFRWGDALLGRYVVPDSGPIN
jgi:hypothetical protein